MEKYFIMAKSQEDAVKHWHTSQYHLADIILALTDNSILEGHKLLGFFNLEAVSAIMNIYKFNFKLAKSELGINGKYVERSGENIMSKDFNPKRSPEVLTLHGEELKQKAQIVYKAIIKQFKKVSDELINNVKKYKKD